MEKKESLKFTAREDFRSWLTENAETSGAVWLYFSKAAGEKTLKASEALEEALCFGWIDGQMKSLSDTAYIKYFSPRRKNSKWSEKNKKLVTELEQRGIMTDLGRARVNEAKENGQWDTNNSTEVIEEQIKAVSELLKDFEPAYTNFLAMSPSVRKTYTKGYFSAKTEAGRESRLKWMVDRLNKNLKPM